LPIPPKSSRISRSFRGYNEHERSIIDTIKSGDAFEEAIDKVSKADVDHYVTPLAGNRHAEARSGNHREHRGTGRYGTTTTRSIDTPVSIAVVSNFGIRKSKPVRSCRSTRQQHTTETAGLKSDDL
jgi:hypothetical protein